jgi:putative sugar O-methyltransferase
MINYNAYLKVCQQATQDEEVFNNFKRHPDYVPILEHVTYEQGVDYLAEINREFPYLLQHIERFSTNDNIGNPNIYRYEELNISPTTLRYIKVLADLMNIFGRLDNINIIEIGGGYGGQCKIIHDICKPKIYTLVDMPEVLSLSKKYLEKHNIKNIVYRNVNDPSETHYDLCISNYAFTEIGRAFQNFYASKIIKNSDMGYITCNFITPENLKSEEILALKTNYIVYEERPLTAKGNFIYTWKL